MNPSSDLHFILYIAITSLILGILSYLTDLAQLDILKSAKADIKDMEFKISNLEEDRTSLKNMNKLFADNLKAAEASKLQHLNYTQFDIMSMNAKIATLEKENKLLKCNNKKLIENLKSIEDSSNIPKEEHQSSNISNKQIGDRYELYVASRFRSVGCQVIYNRLEKGFRDGGIDLHCKKPPGGGRKQEVVLWES